MSELNRVGEWVSGTKESKRICTECKIKWDKQKLGNDCPKCKVDSFFTMNWNDIGVAMHFEHSDDKREDYVEYVEPGQ